MIKVITLLKRKAGMSKEDFIEYYETRHRLIGEKVISGYALRYERRHLHSLDGETKDVDYDVVTEIWFPDQAKCDAFFAYISQNPDIAQEIAEDEEKLFDRTRIRSFAVEEHPSVLPPVA